MNETAKVDLCKYLDEILKQYLSAGSTDYLFDLDPATADSIRKHLPECERCVTNLGEWYIPRKESPESHEVRLALLVEFMLFATSLNECNRGSGEELVEQHRECIKMLELWERLIEHVVKNGATEAVFMGEDSINGSMQSHAMSCACMFVALSTPPVREPLRAYKEFLDAKDRGEDPPPLSNEAMDLCEAGQAFLFALLPGGAGISFDDEP